MSTNIEALYTLPEVPERYRIFFWMQVRRAVDAALISSKSHSLWSVAILHLKEVTQRYDSGGHSMGRSLRSFLLEHVVYKMEYGGKGKRTTPKRILPVLFAMYHNKGLVLRHRWYDGFSEQDSVFLRDSEIRVHLAIALILLKLDKNIPDISGYSDEDFLSLVKD